MKERLFIQAVYPLHALGCQGPVPCARPAPTVAPRQFPVDKGTWPSPCLKRADAHFGDSSDSSAFCIWPDGPDQSNPSTPYRLLPDRARDWLQLLLLLQRPRTHAFRFDSRVQHRPLPNHRRDTSSPADSPLCSARFGTIGLAETEPVLSQVPP